MDERAHYIKRKIKLYDKQHSFVMCRDRFTAFVGGIGSGKTFAGAVKMLALCARKPQGLALVVAPTYPMLRDATLRTYFELFKGGIATFAKADMIMTLKNGWEILFRSASDPNRLRGPNIHCAHIDEGAICPAQTWDIVIGRLRAGGVAGPCWVTTTPKGRNWLWMRRDQITMFRASTHENRYLPREFVESLERAYTGAFAAQEIFGEFVTFEGLVYGEFDRDRHVAPPRRQAITRYVIGVDEGYTNPAVALVVGFDEDGRAYVVHEFYKRQVLQADFVQECAELARAYGAETVYVDPSSAGLIAALREVGLFVRGANNRVMDGIQAVKAALAVQGDGRPRLTVSPDCANTIAEFESYSWDKDRQGNTLDRPLKANDHAMDVLRYVILSEEKRPVIQGAASLLDPIAAHPEPVFRRDMLARQHSDSEAHRRWAKKNFCPQCYKEWQEAISGKR